MTLLKKTAGLLLFFLFLGSTAGFAQEQDQKVTDGELTKFATAFDKLEAANKTAQQKMVVVVEGEGLTMKRFNEIHVAYINPNIKGDASPEEMKKHHRAMQKIKKMQVELQDEMDEIVKKTGLSPKKYQKIASRMQSNMALRERYKKMSGSEKE